VTQFGKWLTLLVVGAIIVLLVTHPAGAAADMAVSGSVLSNVLSIETGQGVKGGTQGQVMFNAGQPGGVAVNFP
jgi:hypothetical protein